MNIKLHARKTLKQITILLLQIYNIIIQSFNYSSIIRNRVFHHIYTCPNVLNVQNFVICVQGNLIK